MAARSRTSKPRAKAAKNVKRRPRRPGRHDPPTSHVGGQRPIDTRSSDVDEPAADHTSVLTLIRDIQSGRVAPSRSRRMVVGHASSI
jgi:hypothetical protein